MSNEPETDDVHVKIIRETEKAYLFKNDDGDESFFPKKEVHFKSRVGDEAIAVIPIWLIESKGW